MASANCGPVARWQVLDANGNIAPGAKIYTYVAGTSNLTNTYTDRTAGTPNANPVVCDASGQATIFFDDSVVYKIVAKDSADATLWTVDNYSANPVIAKATTLTISGNGTVGGTLGVTGAQTNSSTLSATQVTSTVATGTAPFVSTSTTPCTNVHARPVVYSSSGTQQTGYKIVVGASALVAGTVTVTLTSNAVFTSSGTYAVWGCNVSNANAFKIATVSGTQFTITGTGTDTINWWAMGT